MAEANGGQTLTYSSDSVFNLDRKVVDLLTIFGEGQVSAFLVSATTYLAPLPARRANPRRWTFCSLSQ